MRMHIFDDFLNEFHNEQILSHLNDSQNFNWYFFPNVQTEAAPTSIYVSGFRHLFHREGKQMSDYFYTITPIISEVEKKLNKKLVSIINAHANLCLNFGKPFEGLPHMDGYMDCETKTSKRYTVIYYVEDSDGDTILYDNELNETFRCSPQKNRCFIFRSDTWHSGSLPTQHNLRRVININLLLDGEHD